MPTSAVAIGSKHHFHVTSRFRDGVDRLVAGLDEEFGGSIVGNIWNTAEVIVRSGIDWTGWLRYHDRLRSAYLSALRGKPEYRNGVWASEKERKANMWAHNELAFSLSKRIYIPDEVPMPTFVEGKVAKPSIFRWLAERRGVSMDVMFEYFLKSFDSQQFLRTTDAYEPATWNALREASMIVSGDEIPLAAAITDLSMTEVRAALSAILERAERSLAVSQAMLETRRRSGEQAVRSAVAKVRDWNSTYYVLPPPMMTWSDFQSMRQQVKGMAVALGDLHADAIRRKYPLDHIKLTSP